MRSWSGLTVKGKKRSGSNRVLTESRELAATDGVVANSLNLAWIWTSPATNPLERGQSLLWMQHQPAGKWTGRTASLSRPAECFYTSPLIIKWLGKMELITLSVTKTLQQLKTHSCHYLQEFIFNQVPSIKEHLLLYDKRLSLGVAYPWKGKQEWQTFLLIFGRLKHCSMTQSRQNKADIQTEKSNRTSFSLSVYCSVHIF